MREIKITIEKTFSEFTFANCDICHKGTRARRYCVISKLNDDYNILDFEKHYLICEECAALDNIKDKVYVKYTLGKL